MAEEERGVTGSAACLSVAEATERLGVAERFVLDLIERGDFARAGGETLVRMDDLTDFECKAADVASAQAVPAAQQAAPSMLAGACAA